MKRTVIAAILTLVVNIIHAQNPDTLSLSTPGAVEDRFAFIRAKRMAAADVERKKEGTFFTGIPDFSSDPVTGFGFGARTNLYWNGARSNPLFAYTPYLVKLKANAAYYTSNARELALQFDIPYYQGTRWRFKVDVKAQQNPANLYFGLTESTLGNLRLPSNNLKTYDTYKHFNEARKTLRPGEPGEAEVVTDALSNRFKETEFMLNLKADYALGNGKWRVLGGYEIQHLRYKTFEGMQAEGIDPVLGAETKAPNGFSLLRRDFEQGLAKGLNGGLVSLVQAALIYDTRDFEPDPSRGTYFELANEYSSPIIGSAFRFNKVFIQARRYYKLPFGPRTVLASRIAAGNIFGADAPFFEFQDQWSPDGSINSLGGRQSLRGYRANRFLARSLAFANIELRYRVFETRLAKQHFTLTLAPFFDAGTVRDKWQDLGFSKIRLSYGGGARVAWNQSTVVFFDYGASREDNLFFVGVGQVF